MNTVQKKTNYRRSFMFRSYVHASLFIPLFASSLLAVPKIEFDTKAFKCGTIIEGKTEKLKASFVVKNSGDELLKIQGVRPGCGCTVVKYDSLVPPGKTIKIEAEVNIKGYRAGSISKAITVTSNAANEQSVRLAIEATIESLIDAVPTDIDLDAAKGNMPYDVQLFSKKADLKVTDVSLSVDNDGTQDWQSKVPLTIKFDWKSTDSPGLTGTTCTD
jgi:hypothetical protein